MGIINMKATFIIVITALISMIAYTNAGVLSSTLKTMSSCGDKASPSFASCTKESGCCYVTVSLAGDKGEMCAKAINEEAAKRAFDASFKQVKAALGGKQITGPEVKCPGGSKSSGTSSTTSA